MSEELHVLKSIDFKPDQLILLMKMSNREKLNEVKRPRTVVTSGENLKRKNELFAWCSGSAPVEEGRRLLLPLPSIARLNAR